MSVTRIVLLVAQRAVVAEDRHLVEGVRRGRRPARGARRGSRRRRWSRPAEPARVEQRVEPGEVLPRDRHRPRDRERHRQALADRPRRAASRRAAGRPRRRPAGSPRAARRALRPRSTGRVTSSASDSATGRAHRSAGPVEWGTWPTQCSPAPFRNRGRACTRAARGWTALAFRPREAPARIEAPHDRVQPAGQRRVTPCRTTAPKTRIEGVEIVELKRFNDDGGVDDRARAPRRRPAQAAPGLPGAPGELQRARAAGDQGLPPAQAPDRRLVRAAGATSCCSSSATCARARRPRGRCCASVLGDGNSRLVRIPPGVAHGCRNLRPATPLRRSSTSSTCSSRSARTATRGVCPGITSAPMSGKSSASSAAPSREQGTGQSPR